MTRQKTKRSASRSRSAKRAFISSVLALALCFVMLLGTTFAWFTDTASTKVNTIQSGTLDVDIVDKEGSSVNGKMLDFVKADDAPDDEEVLWEPGCTYQLPTVRVVNNGNLALKYKVVFTQIGGDKKLADVIDVYVGGLEEANRKGTLADVLKLFENDSVSSDGVLKGNLLPKNSKDDDGNALDTSENYTVYLHMQESAGNTYQGLKISGIAVAVLATQDTVEWDSSTNQYDENATFDHYAAVKGNSSAYKAAQDGANLIEVVKDFTIYSNKNNDNKAAFYFSKEANGFENAASEVTLFGSNTVTTVWQKDSPCTMYTIRVDKGVTLTIAGGTYKMIGTDGSKLDQGDLLYVNGGTIIVSGGTFILENGDKGTFNMSGDNHGTILLRGGTYNFDPNAAIESKDDYNAETGYGIKVDDGYKVVEESVDGTDWWKIVPST